MQSKLGDFGTGGQTTFTPDSRNEESDDRDPLWTHLLSPQATVEGGSCPWCLHPEDELTTTDEQVSCPHCEAVIPTTTEWYQDGQKMIDISRLV